MSKAAPPARFVTFYSYKGGTGRSMALANVAWLLARAGQRVLVVDWDLEAPGLHRYFRPFLADPDLTSTEGVIDFVVRFVEDASERDPDVPLRRDWYVQYSNIGSYAKPIDYDFPGGGSLDFIGAGRQDRDYGKRVNSFNWKHFYERLGGWSVIEAMRAHLSTDFDIVLIDSRTGVSDTSGICTVQLPDDVVVCFTLNSQSVDGAAVAAASIVEQRQRLSKPIRVFPVPMRVVKEEKLKREVVTAYAQARFFPLLDAATAGSRTDQERYWQEVEVPHEGFYAFEEQLAWFLDPATQVAGVLASTKRISRYLTGRDLSDLDGPGADERQQALAGFSDAWREPAVSDVETVGGMEPAPRTHVYVSLPDGPAGGADAVLDTVEAFIAPTATVADAGADQPLDDAIRSGLARSRAMVYVVGPQGIGARQRREIVAAAEQRLTRGGGRGLPIVPVVLPDTPPELLPISIDAVVDLATPLKGRDASPPGTATTVDRQLEDIAGASGLRSTGPRSPYPGTRPFRTEEGELYRGPQDSIDDLVRKIRRSRSVDISGPTGSGRTSLVAAGVIPALLAQTAPDPTWKAVTFSAATDIWGSLADALVRCRLLPSAPPFAREVTGLADALRRDDGAALRDAVEKALPAVPAADRLLLVADDVPPGGEHHAIRLLRAWLDTLPVTMLCVLDGASTVPRPTAPDLRLAIEAPAQLTGLRLDPSLANAMAADLDGVDQPLPLLQFCLERLWELRRDNALTTEAYRSLGGARDAVGGWAEAAVSSLDFATVVRVLSRLVDVPTTGAPVRNSAALSVLPPAWTATAGALVRSGLVRQAPDGDVRLTLAPLLLEHWPRLAAAIEQDRAFLLIRQRLTRPVAMPGAGANPLPRGTYAIAPDEARTLLERPDDLTADEQARARAIVEEHDSRIQAALRRSQRQERQRLVFAAIGLVVIVAGVITYRMLANDPGPAASQRQIEVVSGNGLVLQGGRRFTVRALDERNAAVAGAKVLWQVEGCRYAMVVTTDVMGTASTADPCPNADLTPGPHALSAIVVGVAGEGAILTTALEGETASVPQRLSEPVTIAFTVVGRE